MTCFQSDSVNSDVIDEVNVGPAVSTLGECEQLDEAHGLEVQSS